ncbi:CDF family Co(II)/Ni(II) efflux transporter DmeF [Ramlibacter aquaticus]|uniref:CDF family Co(II)/Ni(II) efflux transporter DmeF n=1 Tax=Ramlibacter aquaticus TaxID=2780094 RepID=A0ABR9SCT0_9BURK|nr:CDF family Co(II)/Ni(II) efflux transporter DmeF [Ramlibacter aquaticus]MBE7940143.1 CDF family Co(II)/Ni(II) efflux transporter DmeF [Ramlibacter aquaticus]
MSSDTLAHGHVFLAPGHERSERKTWAVIWLCGLMMVAEIVGGTMFGSVALIADGLHMSTHAGALLIAALAYTYARRHATDPRFSFGTGKLGDLAGFTSAIILAMIALLIGYEAVSRLLSPVPINFNQAIPIAIFGLAVNVASAWLLSGGDHGHHHGHGHPHGEAEGEDEVRRVDTVWGPLVLEVFEDGVPPRFRLHDGLGGVEPASAWMGATVETQRPDGSRQLFRFVDRGAYLESIEEIPEPHEFDASLSISRAGLEEFHEVSFEEHDHGHGEPNAKTHRDNNFRAALVHVIADAAVSVLVIAGLILARQFGWLWIDPLVGVVGALVIANWSFGLIRDTGAILLDMNADGSLAKRIREALEGDGDRLADLHLWRLGPGHLGAIVSVSTPATRDAGFYRAKLSRFGALSHVTVEVRPS